MNPSSRVRRARPLERLFVIAWTLQLGLAAAGRGELFPVTDTPGFQSALTAAQNNGESDTIQLAAGNYPVTTTLVYSSGEEHSLEIVGAGIGATVLVGGGSNQILSLESWGDLGHLRIEGMTLQNGAAAGTGGGALYLETAAANQTLEACEIVDSSTTGEGGIGGGAAAVASSGDVTVRGSAFRRNTSHANVGGFYAATGSGTLTLESSVFESNAVDNSGGSSYFGDGGGAMLYTEDGGVTVVTGCTFSGNGAAGGDNPDGGGLMIYQLGSGVTMTVESSTFVGNEAGLGGGGLFARINATGAIVCRNNELDSNLTGLGSGAGAFLYVDGGTLEVTGNRAVDNDAGEDGGGIWISHGSGSATVSDNVLDGNTAGVNGGGLTLVTESATSALERNVFLGNTAGNVGAGLSYATGNGSLALSRTTFSGNVATGEGGGLYVYLDQDTASTSFVDLILWNDTPDELAFSSGTGSASLELRYSDVEGGTGADWFGDGCLDTDPLFVDAAAGDLRLAWPTFPDPGPGQSPCIDTGDPASPADPDGTRADMGALSFDQTALLFRDGFESGDTTAWGSASP